MRALAIALLFSAALSAQEFRGTILGRITDPSGAPVPGAAVSAVNVETGVPVKTSSNEVGDYQLLFLPPGTYTVTVQRDGFQKLVREGIGVSIELKLVLNLELKIGATTESVTVTASAPLLEAANADLGMVIEKRIIDLGPFGIGSPLNLTTQMTPTVQGSTGGNIGGASSNWSVMGGGNATGNTSSATGGNEIMVDGIPQTLPIGSPSGKPAFIPMTEGTEEVKVQTTLFDASYGHSNGGAISISTKTGTNDLHGAAFITKGWKVLNANSWTNNRNGVPRGPVNSYTTGISGGGPVYIPKLYNGRNRTFFFASFKKNNNKSAFTEQARVPTELERQGDFSQTRNLAGTAPVVLYNPYTSVVSNGSFVSRSPFPGNVIPQSMINPVGKAVMNNMPLPNNITGPTQLGSYNWVAPGLYWQPEPIYQARVDHMLNDRQRLYFSFGELVRNQNSNVFFPGAWSFPGMGYSNLGIDHIVQHSYSLNDTITFSPTFVASISFAVTDYWELFAPAPAQDPTKLNLPSQILSNQAIKGWPVFSFPSAENLIAVGTTGGPSTSYSETLLANFTKLQGRHSLKFGMDVRFPHRNSHDPGSSSAGQFQFSPGFTQANPSVSSTNAVSGTAMASLLLGLPSGGSLGYNATQAISDRYYGLFLQDDWKITSKLTLNFGLRYELETPFTERYNRASYGFDRNAALPITVPGYSLKGGIMFAGVNGNPRGMGNTDANNFGPRFGFAYAVTPRTVIRGGYGMFFSSVFFDTSSYNSIGTFNAVTSYVSSQDGGATPYTDINNPFPNGLVAPVGSSQGLLSQIGNSISFLDQNRVAPYAQQRQISIQHEFPSRTLVEIQYAGMLSAKGFESYNLNELPDQYLSLGAGLNASTPNPFYKIFPASSSLGTASVTRQRLLVAYPQFTSVSMNAGNTLRSTYNSGTIKVDKRLTHGLSVVGTYTRSRAMVYTGGSLVNERHWRGTGANDQPNAFRLTAVYSLPFTMKGANPVLRHAAAGWTISGFFTYTTGTPLSISQTNGIPVRIAQDAYSGSVQNRLGDHKVNGIPTNPYFNINAFAPLPTQYMISPEALRFPELRAPARPTFNLTVNKTFHLYERINLEFISNAGNLFNTPSFSSPGTNMSNPSTFGVITSGGSPRSVGMAARLRF